MQVSTKVHVIFSQIFPFGWLAELKSRDGKYGGAYYQN